MESNNNQNRNKIIERIKKILARAEGTQYPAEAETAMRIAQGYMKSHGLSMTDIELHESVADSHIIKEGIEDTLDPEAWEKLLGLAVAHVCECEIFISFTTYLGRARRTINFVGYEQDVFFARILFSTLIMETKRASGEAIKGRYKTPKARKLFRASYRLGLAQKLLERAREEKIITTKEDKTGKYELIVSHKKNQIRHYMTTKLNLKLKSKPTNFRYDHEAFQLGRSQASKLDLQTRKKLNSGLNLTHKKENQS